MHITIRLSSMMSRAGVPRRQEVNASTDADAQGSLYLVLSLRRTEPSQPSRVIARTSLCT